MELKGLWLRINDAGAYASSYASDSNIFKGTKEFRYFFPEAFGVYTVQEYHPAAVTYATNTPLRIRHCTGTSTFYIDQTTAGSTWNNVAKVCFGASTTNTGATIVIGTDGTTQTVVADGIRIVRAISDTERTLHCGHFAVSLSPRVLQLADTASSSVGAYLNKYLNINGERRNIFAYDPFTRRVTVDQVFTLGQTTLAAEVLTTTTNTLSVVHAESAGIIAGRLIEIDTEIMSVTSVATNTVQVSRGAQNTEAAVHKIGSEIRTVFLAGQIVNSGAITATSAPNVVTLALSAPALADVFVGSQIAIGYENGVETRTIVAYSAGRIATVNPPFQQTLFALVSAYTITTVSVYSITEEPLRGVDGSTCTPLCSIPPRLLFTSPRAASTLSIATGTRRIVDATGAELRLATAGVPATFTVTVKDLSENVMPYQPGVVVYVNMTRITSTYGYGATIITSGVVTVAGDAYSFTLSNTADAVADTYLGYYITISKETRTIMGYTAGRVVTINEPFGFAPTTSSKWTITAERSGHKWFQAAAMFRAQTSVANPSTVSVSLVDISMHICIHTHIYSWPQVVPGFAHVPSADFCCESFDCVGEFDISMHIYIHTHIYSWPQVVPCFEREHLLRILLRCR